MIEFIAPDEMDIKFELTVGTGSEVIFKKNCNILTFLTTNNYN